MQGKLAFFAGSDISSAILLNRTLSELSAVGRTAVVYFPNHRAPLKKQPTELKRLSFYERDILSEFVYPFLDAHKPNDAALCCTPTMLSEKFDVKVVRNVNSPYLLNELRDKGVDGGISIRCYQKFGDPLIDYFNNQERGFFWNLHPGILPKYKGVMTFVRAMVNGDKETSFTLHEIDREFDTGGIIAQDLQPLDFGLPVLTNMFNILPSGERLILDSLDRLDRGEGVKVVPQEKSGVYYSYPTQEDFEAFKARGIKMVSPEDVINNIVASFSEPNTDFSKSLRSELTAYVQKWEVKQRKENALETHKDKVFC